MGPNEKLSNENPTIEIYAREIIKLIFAAPEKDGKWSAVFYMKGTNREIPKVSPVPEQITSFISHELEVYQALTTLELTMV